MAKVLTQYTPDEMLLLEAGLAETDPVRTISQQNEVAMVELLRQGLFAPVAGGWALTDRGRLVAEGVQRQGRAASLGGRAHP